MISRVLTLIITLLDIIRLQKGPNAIPRSPVLLVVVVAAWMFAGTVIITLIAGLDQTDFVVSLMTGALGLLAYSIIAVAHQKTDRLLQMLTAILGIGAMIQFLFVAGHVFLTPFLGKNFAALLSYLVLLWSVPVEGHIIARTINREWYIGLLIAIAVFFIQVQLGSVFNPAEPVAP
ncbi:MAG: hypothetical protein K0U72_10930 [Gammaproteobacteria bacterium]|nr:hypothetical protein [Gammaproteobacteria bacterium]